MTVTRESLREHADWLDDRSDLYVAEVLRDYAYDFPFPEDTTP